MELGHTEDRNLELVGKELQHRWIRMCWLIPPELLSGLGCIPGGVWVWEGSRVQLLRSSEKKFLEKWTNNLLAMDSCVAAGCWTIPSVWYCFCLGLLSPALAWHPAMKWKNHFVLSSAVRQGKKRPSSWHVCTPKTCTCLMGVVDRASPEVLTCSVPEQSLGTSSKNFLCPAFAFPTAV